MKERAQNGRKHTRVIFKTKAIVESGTASLEGQVRNLSLNGMLVGLTKVKTMEIGDDVVVSMMIEGKSALMTIRLRGTIIRVQENTLAVVFDPRLMEVDSLLLLKTVILSNGGDRQKVEKEFKEILTERKKNNKKS